jgi:hypothetical protein
MNFFAAIGFQTHDLAKRTSSCYSIAGQVIARRTVKSYRKCSRRSTINTGLAIAAIGIDH